MYDILIENGFIRNEYFDKYVALIEKNKTTAPQKYKTQRHHIFPKCITKRLNLTKDIAEQKVNLLYKDHVLAHFLLCMCCEEEYYKFLLTSAFHFLYYGKYCKNPNAEFIKCEGDLLVEHLDDIQRLYELNKELKSKYSAQKLKGRKRGPLSAEHKQKLREANLGKHHSEETKAKLRKPRHSEEWKQHLSKEYKGRVCITNGKVTKRVKSDDLQYYLDSGWKEGWCTTEKQITTNQDPIKRAKCSATLMNHTVSEETKNLISQNTKLAMTDEIKQHLSELVKGTKWYNNGEQEHLYHEGDQPDDWVPGRLSKGLCWYNNGEIECRCKEGEQPENYKRGRLKSNVKQ